LTPKPAFSGGRVNALSNFRLGSTLGKVPQLQEKIVSSAASTISPQQKNPTTRLKHRYQQVGQMELETIE
jgi:hypothetical protein